MRATAEQMGNLQPGTEIHLDDNTTAIVSYAFWDGDTLVFVVENDDSLWRINERNIGASDVGFLASTEDVLIL